VTHIAAKPYLSLQCRGVHLGTRTISGRHVRHGAYKDSPLTILEIYRLHLNSCDVASRCSSVSHKVFVDRTMSRQRTILSLARLLFCSASHFGDLCAWTPAPSSLKDNHVANISIYVVLVVDILCDNGGSCNVESSFVSRHSHLKTVVQRSSTIYHGHDPLSHLVGTLSSLLPGYCARRNLLFSSRGRCWCVRSKQPHC
jgi:hypothetical protein